MTLQPSGQMALALGASIFAFGGVAHAQGVGQINPDIPSCGSPWSLVSKDGRNPCQMLFAVMNPCAMQDNGLPFSLSNVSSQPLGIYAAPLSEIINVDRCQCTEAGYNLYSACTACQVGNIDTHWLTRADWFAGCPSVRSSGRVQAFPPSTAADELDEWIVHPYDPKFSVAAALNVANNVSAGSTTSTISTSLSNSPVTFAPHVITNTATTTLLTIVLQTDGTNSILTLPPGASATVIEVAGTETSSSSSIPLPAIIGGTVGGAVAVLALAIAVWFWRRRRSAQHTAHPEQPADEASSLPGDPGATAIKGIYSDEATDNGERATSQMDTSLLAISPATISSNNALTYTGSSSTSSTPLTSPGSGGVWSGAGIPPGAMAPRMGSIHEARLNGKARFTPSKSTLAPSSPAATVAPPPYSQGGCDRDSLI